MYHLILDIFVVYREWVKGCISDSRPKHKLSHSSDITETCFFDGLLIGRAASGSGGNIRMESFMFRPRIADTTFNLAIVNAQHLVR